MSDTGPLERHPPLSSLTGDENAHTATRVANQMREQITRGVLLPGVRLKDTSLAEAHQVSRNTLRDALRQLENDGLVVLRRNAGYAVRVLTEEDAHDIYRVRHLLESAGVDASTRVPRDGLAPLTASVDAERAAARDRMWAEVGTTGLRLHQGIVGLIGSPRTNAFFATIIAQLRLVFAVMEDEASFQAQWMDRDEELLELILTGQRRQAQLELTQYLIDSEMQIIDAIRATSISD
jgi:DNA-binding GntR family transcriptional regulator